MDPVEDSCGDLGRDRKKATTTTTKRNQGDKGGRRSKTPAAGVKTEDTTLSHAAGSGVLPKPELDESLLQHNVFTEILNMKKKELLENDVLINSLFPFKRE